MSLFYSRVKLEFYVDCLGQFLSMIIWLGWQSSVVALVGQVGSLNMLEAGWFVEIVWFDIING